MRELSDFLTCGTHVRGDQPFKMTFILVPNVSDVVAEDARRVWSVILMKSSESLIFFSEEILSGNRRSFA